MISLISGTLRDKSPDRVTIDVSGVGYEVLVPAATLSDLPAVGKPASVFTRLQVRDDALVLYGFATADERALFDILVKVSGVGPKFALAILSVLTPDALRRAVIAGDIDALTVVPGIGKKVAGRLVLDLKDKLGAGDAGEAPPAGPLGEVRDALLALGLSPEEARTAMAGLANGNGHGERPVEELLREALQTVGRA
jgi:Holliday junction DNA helicase RuvA